MIHKLRAPTDSQRAIVSAALLFLLAAGLASCGKISPPVPPSRLTLRTSQLAAIQRGATVVLSWPAPPLGNQESSRSYVSRIDIYRLTEGRDQEPILDPDDYEDTAKVVGYLDRATLEAQINATHSLQYTDALQLAQADIANVRLRYAVRYLNQRGQAATFSNTVAIEPAAVIAMPPTGLEVKNEGQDRISLEWKAPDANVDGTRPASIAGYNVFRSVTGRGPSNKPLNSEPITALRFTDTRFQYEADYAYFVRAVSQGPVGLVESSDSPSVSIKPIDTFPPAPPDPVSVASANGIVSLFWPSSPERDVAGYDIYRANAEHVEEKDWVKLNGPPLGPVTFRDEAVVIDRKYFYRVTAVDVFKNESKPSRVVSEIARQ